MIALDLRPNKTQYFKSIIMEKLTPLKKVLENISKITLKKQNMVKLLAVTKKRSIDQIRDLYDQGQREFGENYVNDIEEKSTKLPEDIKWSMIGHLQSNKARKLLKVKNLTAIHSVDSFKLAEEIDSQCKKLERTVDIFLQVNISRENSKSGCEIDDVVSVYKEIHQELKNVKIIGLMSLGTIDSAEEFDLMYRLKEDICKELKLDLNDLLLSFGTSADYENAIKHGSNIVRVGSTLFSN